MGSQTPKLEKSQDGTVTGGGPTDAAIAGNMEQEKLKKTLLSSLR
jgi:hypothetical protein